MDSDAGSSAARRRRLVSTISGCFISISLFFTAFLHSFIEGLGLLVFSAVKGCARRRRRYHTQALLLLFIICNTLSPFSTTIVSDLSMATRVRGAPRLSLWPDLKLHHYIQAFWPLVFTRHTSLRCSSPLISTVNLSSDVCGVPPFSRRPDMEPQRSVSSHNDHSVSLQTRSASLFGSGLSSQKPLEAAHTDECSFSQSLLDFTDLRLSVEYVKSPWLHHGNDGVGFCCLNSAIALSESMIKPISLSDVNVKSSEVHISFFGAISGVHSKFPSEVHHQRPTPTSASIKLSLFLDWSLLKVEDCSPLVLFLSRKAIQTSSCRGHEKSLSIFLLFMGVKSSIKTPPFGRYFSFGFKAKDLCRIPYRLLPCVMVRLGPEGTTRLIQMRIEVMERSTSRYTVTISMVEDFEGRCNLFVSLLVCGTLRISFDLLSSLSKFVFLSFYGLVLKTSIRTAHRIIDVAFILVSGLM